MERLSALDALWLEADRAAAPLTIGSVMILDGPGPGVAAIRSLIAERLPRMPRLRQRIEVDPTGLRQRAWVDAAPDLHQHVIAAALSTAPGALDRAVSHILQSPLALDRPLWDLHVLHRRDGRWVLVWRLHHAMADGEGSAMLLGHLYDLRPDGGPTMTEVLRSAPARNGGTGTGVPAVNPSATDLADRLWTQPLARLGALTTSGARALLPTVRSARELAPGLPGPLSGAVSDSRHWRSATVPLDVARRASKALGATVNDIVVTAVTSGFRAWLLATGHQPDHALRAVVPVSMRIPGDEQADNQVAMFVTGLPVGTADPRRRLDQVRAANQDGKASLVPKVMESFWVAVDRVVPAAVQELVVAGSGRLTGAFVDTLITNVPGPAFTLYVAGSRTLASYPIIPIGAHLRITVGVVSYDATLHIGLTTDAEHIPDPDGLIAAIRMGFDELANLPPGG